MNWRWQGLLQSWYDDAAMHQHTSKNSRSLFARQNFLFFLWLSCWLLTVQAATSLQGYTSRVEEAAKLAADVADNDYGRAEETEILQRLQMLLPSTEDIERAPASHDVIHIDNAWLHNAIKKLESANENKRAMQLAEISERLQALHKQLQASLQPTATANASNPQERVQKILQRDEYKPDEEKDSKIQAWLKNIKKQILDFLAKLFGGRKPNAPEIGSGQIGIFQIFVVAGLAVILLWALVTLLKRWQFREARLSDDEELSGVREVLGEQLDVDATAEDLLKDASELARRGEYRAAMRRAYIAALYELEQRGKLRLHRAKTNSDYLRELRGEPQLYPPVSSMTNNYERVWYGNDNATMEDYSGFLERYKEVAK